MYIPDFHYHQPKSIEEAFQVLDSSPHAVPLAGGTDLLVELKQGKRRCHEVVSLTRIPELRTIRSQGDRLCIGAATTLSQLVASPLIQEHWPVIAEAAGAIATEQIRNVATIGGNLCTAASCCDTAPILIALEAELEIASSRDERCVALRDFFVTHRETVVKDGEIVTRILVPIPARGTGASYQRFGLREAATIAVASVAAQVRLVGKNCSHACFVMGAVAPTPKISRNAARLVEGRAGSELAADVAILARVGEAAAADADPIDDLRGSAEYRRTLVAVLAQRALLEALGRAQQ